MTIGNASHDSNEFNEYYSQVYSNFMPLLNALSPILMNGSNATFQSEEVISYYSTGMLYYAEYARGLSLYLELPNATDTKNLKCKHIKIKISIIKYLAYNQMI
jgi:predicted DNA-binding ArsR family transcriptional regulator